MAEDRHAQHPQAPESNERDAQDVAKKSSQGAVAMSAGPVIGIDRGKPSLSSLPDDVIAKIISFLPSCFDWMFERCWRVAYSNLSLSCLNPRYTELYANSFKHVEALIHPCHTRKTSQTNETSFRYPPHLRKPFLSLLLRQCPNITTLRVPCVSGLLQYAGNHIEDITFEDTLLTDDDFRFLSTARLKTVSVSYPSARLFVALSQVRTLEDLELRQVYEITHLIDFLSSTTASSILLSFDSPDLTEPVLAVFQGLTHLKSFTFVCTRHHLWTLPYLRKLAMTVRNVTMIIEGFKIFVQPANLDLNDLNDLNEDDYTWEEEIELQLFFRDRLDASEVPDTWHVDVHLLRLDVGHVLNALRRGMCQDDLVEFFCDYYRRDDVDGIPIELRLNSFTSDLRLLKLAWNTIRDCASDDVRSMKISFIYILLAGQRHDLSVYRSVSQLISGFQDLARIQICAESKSSAPCPLSNASLLSPRFIMGLVAFLRMATRSKQLRLRTVILEEAGELVLQRTGVSVLSDEKTVKRLIHSVIAWIKKLENEKNLQLGTIVGQLQYWASRPLRKVDRNELDDVRAISCLSLQQHTAFDDGFMDDFDDNSNNDSDDAADWESM